MKPIFSLFALLLLTLTACNQEECRDCATIAFDYSNFDPTVAEDEIVLRSATGETVTFELARFEESPANTVCSTVVDDPADISCSAVVEGQYISEDLGIDMAINFLELVGQRGVPTQVVESFSFKARNFSQFERTHAVVLQPNIVLEDEVVELRDTLTIDGVTYADVLALLQPAAAFEVLVNLPDAGRFTEINVKEGVGLLRLVDVDGNVYNRVF